MALPKRDRQDNGASDLLPGWELIRGAVFVWKSGKVDYRRGVRRPATRGRVGKGKRMNTVQIVECNPPGTVRWSGNITATIDYCDLAPDGTLQYVSMPARQYTEIVEENELLKAEIAQLNERLAALE